MDVSAETADLVVKESLQATESAAKLLGSGVKNVAALLLAIAKDNYKVVGKTNSKREIKAGMSMWCPPRTTPPSSTPSWRPWAIPFPSRPRPRRKKHQKK